MTHRPLTAVLAFMAAAGFVSAANAATMFPVTEDKTITRTDKNFDNKHIATFGYQADIADRRGALEFDLGSDFGNKKVENATFSFTESQPGRDGNVSLFGYAGDGVVNNADAERLGDPNLMSWKIGEVTNTRSDRGQQFSFDVTSFLSDLSDENARYAGFVFKSAEPDDPFVASISICSSESPAFGGLQCADANATPNLTASLSEAASIPLPSTVGLFVAGTICVAAASVCRDRK